MGVLDEMRELGDLIKKAGDSDLYRRIVKLEGEVIDLTREKRNAEERVEELERALQFKGQLTFKAPYYWLEGDPEPYCPACWTTRKLVHVVTVRMQGIAPQMQCPSCKFNYGRGSIS